MFKKIPDLNKDLLWAGCLAVILVLAGRPFLGFPLVNYIIFLIFAFMTWRDIKVNNEMNFILTTGRVFVLLSIISILAPLVILISSVFTPVGIQRIASSLVDPVRLMLWLGLIVYGLQYYIFTLWKRELNFKTQKNLIFLEIAGLALLYIIGLGILTPQ